MLEAKWHQIGSWIISKRPPAQGRTSKDDKRKIPPLEHGGIRPGSLELSSSPGPPALTGISIAFVCRRITMGIAASVDSSCVGESVVEIAGVSGGLLASALVVSKLLTV